MLPANCIVGKVVFMREVVRRQTDELLGNVRPDASLMIGHPSCDGNQPHRWSETSQGSGLERMVGVTAVSMVRRIRLLQCSGIAAQGLLCAMDMAVTSLVTQDFVVVKAINVHIVLRGHCIPSEALPR